MGREVTWADFAAYLRHIRAVRGLSQKQLARLMECSEHHLWRLEKGDRHPSKARLLLLREKGWLQPEDEPLCAAFELMVEYRCDAVELEEAVRRLPVYHRRGYQAQKPVEGAACATSRRGGG